ncbi:MAG: hypothetical protein [Cressdnaviricota sp.]|nr:MAG: hypothetical protein [Cressdnaviricota sp.]
MLAEALGVNSFAYSGWAVDPQIVVVQVAFESSGGMVVSLELLHEVGVTGGDANMVGDESIEREVLSFKSVSDALKIIAFSWSRFSAEFFDFARLGAIIDVLLRGTTGDFHMSQPETDDRTERPWVGELDIALKMGGAGFADFITKDSKFSRRAELPDNINGFVGIIILREGEGAGFIGGTCRWHV